MNISRSDLEAILRDSEKRRDQIREELPRLEETIAAVQTLLRNIYNADITSTTAPGSSSNGQGGGALTVARLAEAILKESGRSLDSQEIALQIMARGKTFKSNNPRTSVYTILRRHRDKFQIRKGRWSLKHDREGD